MLGSSLKSCGFSFGCFCSAWKSVARRARGTDGAPGATCAPPAARGTTSSGRPAGFGRALVLVVRQPHGNHRRRLDEHDALAHGPVPCKPGRDRERELPAVREGHRQDSAELRTLLVRDFRPRPSLLKATGPRNHSCDLARQVHNTYEARRGSRGAVNRVFAHSRF